MEMYTANTMSAAIEALGLSLPAYSSSLIRAEFLKKLMNAFVGKYLYHLLEEDIKPSDILDEEIF